MTLTEPLLTTYGVAEVLGVTPRRIGRLIRDGRLPYIEIDGEVRFDPEDVQRFVQSHKRPPVASDLPTLVTR